MLSSFIFNGHSSEEFGIRIEKKPVLNRSSRKFQSASVPGRNGNIYQLEDAWNEVIQPYEIFAGDNQEGAVIPSFTAIMEWLNSADGYAKLQDTYDPEHYRMAIFVDATNIASEWHDFGRATINFRCRPEHYIEQDPIEVDDGDIITNETNHVAKPLITLTGSGPSSLLNLEKQSPPTNYTAFYYHPELMYYMSFIATGTNNGRIVIVQYSDDYADYHGGYLALKRNEDGVLSFHPFDDGNVGMGTTIEVNPNTDYTISGTSNTKCKLWVAFFSDDSQLISRTAELTKIGGSMELTVHTPEDCSKMLIVFFAPNNNTIAISDIMVAKGNTAQEFKAYEADTTETVTIGGTTLKIMMNGFGTAMIDCEKENFNVDGVDNNTSVSIVDEYDNLSADYLQLVKGDNEVTYSEGISSVTVDPRFWEL